MNRKENNMNIHEIKTKLTNSGIPGEIISTGGDVECFSIITFEGEFLVSPSEVNHGRFMLGLYDRDGEQIEFADNLPIAEVEARILQAL